MNYDMSTVHLRQLSPPAEQDTSYGTQILETIISSNFPEMCNIVVKSTALHLESKLIFLRFLDRKLKSDDSDSEVIEDTLRRIFEIKKYVSDMLKMPFENVVSNLATKFWYQTVSEVLSRPIPTVEITPRDDEMPYNDMDFPPLSEPEEKSVLNHNSHLNEDKYSNHIIVRFGSDTNNCYDRSVNYKK
jgi:hypothetical protein